MGIPPGPDAKIKEFEMTTRNVKNTRNDYAAIQVHIQRAQLARSVAISEALANAIMALLGGVKRFFANAATANNPALPTR
jgi:hypothetical protein